MVDGQDEVARIPTGTLTRKKEKPPLIIAGWGEPTRTVQEGQQTGTLGQYVRFAHASIMKANDPLLSRDERAAHQKRAYRAMTDLEIYTWDNKVGSEVRRLISTLSMTDVAGRLKSGDPLTLSYIDSEGQVGPQGEYIMGEAEWLAQKKAEYDEKVANYKKGQWEAGAGRVMGAHSAVEHPGEFDPILALSSFYGAMPVDEVRDHKGLLRELGPPGEWKGEFLLTNALSRKPLYTEDEKLSLDLERVNAAMNSPLTWREGAGSGASLPFVKTSRGLERIQQYTETQRNAIQYALMGVAGGTFIGMGADAIQQLAKVPGPPGDLLRFMGGSAYRYINEPAPETFGIRWKSVPVITGNFDIDRRSLHDPVMVRSYLENLASEEGAEPGPTTAYKAGSEAFELSIFLADFAAWNKTLGLGMRAAGMAKAGMGRHMRGVLGESKQAEFFVGYAGAAKRAVVESAKYGDEVILGGASPVVRGARRSMFDLGLYSGVAAEVTGGADPHQEGSFGTGFEEGVAMGLTGSVLGTGSRMARWPLAKLIGKATRASGIKHTPLMTDTMAKVGAKVRSGAIGRFFAMAPPRLKPIVGDYAAARATMMEGAYAARNRSQLLGAATDSFMVGKGFAAIAASQEHMAALNRPWDPGDSEAISAFWESLSSPTSGLVGGLIFGLHTAGTYGLPLRGAPGFEGRKGQAKKVRRYANETQAEIIRLKDWMERAQVTMEELENEDPAAVVKWFDEWIKKEGLAVQSRAIRNAMGKSEPRANDPHDIESFVVDDLYREFKENETWTVRAMNDMSSHGLSRIVDEIRTLPTSRGADPAYEGPTKESAAGLRHNAMGLLDARRKRVELELARDPKLEEQAAWDRIDDEAISRNRTRISDPYATEIEKRIAEGITRKDKWRSFRLSDLKDSKRLFKALGFKDAAEAMARVNDTFGREYTDPGQVTLQDAYFASKMGRMAKVRAKLQGEIAQHVQELGIKPAPVGAEAPPAGAEVRTDHLAVLYEALRTNRDYLGLSPAEVFQKWKKNRFLRSQEALETAIRETWAKENELTNLRASDEARMMSDLMLDFARPESADPKPERSWMESLAGERGAEPDLPAAEVVRPEPPTAEPPLPPRERLSAPALQLRGEAAFSLDQGRRIFKKSRRHANVFEAVGHRISLEAREDQVDAMIAGALLESAAHPKLQPVIAAVLGVSRDRVKRVRQEMVARGYAAVERFLPALREMKVSLSAGKNAGKAIFSPKSLSDHRTRELLGLIASGAPVESTEAGRSSFIQDTLVSDWTDAIKFAGERSAGAADPGSTSAFLRAQLPAVQKAMAAVPKPKGTKKSVGERFSLLTLLAQRVARQMFGQGDVPKVRNKWLNTDIGDGRTPFDVALDVIETISGIRPQLQTTVTPGVAKAQPGKRVPVQEGTQRPAEEQMDPLKDWIRHAADLERVWDDLLRLRTPRTDEEGRETMEYDVDAAADQYDPRNAAVLGALVRGDKWLKEKFSESRNPGDQGPTFFTGDFEKTQAAAISAMDYFSEAFLATFRFRQENTGLPVYDQARAMLTAVRARRDGAKMSPEAEALLRKLDFIEDGPAGPQIKRGAENLMLRDFYDFFVRDIGTQQAIETMMDTKDSHFLFGGPSARMLHPMRWIETLSGRGSLGLFSGYRMDASETFWWAKIAQAAGYGTVHGTPVRDYLIREFATGKPSNWAKALDKAVGSRANIFRSLIGNELWARPEYNPWFSTKRKKAAMAARTYMDKARAMGEEIVIHYATFTRDLSNSGLTAHELTIFTKMVENFGKVRMRSPADVLRGLPVHPATGKKLLQLMDRYVEIANDVGRTLVLNGAIEPQQLEKWIDHYIPFIRSESAADRIKRAGKGIETDRGSFDQEPFELERETEFLTEIIGQVTDSRQILPQSASPVGKRVTQMGYFTDLSFGRGAAISRLQWERLPPSERGEWLKVSVTTDDLLGMSEVQIHRAKQGQRMVGVWVEQMRRGVEGRAPKTELKQDILDRLEGLYAPISTIRANEIFMTMQDPNYSPDNGLAQKATQMVSIWRGNKTWQKPMHVLRNVYDSIGKNDLLGVVPMQDFAAGIISGKGAYAESFKAGGAWNDWVLGINEYAGWGSRNRDRLLAERPEAAEVLEFDKFVELAGGGTLLHSLGVELPWSNFSSAIMASPQGKRELRKERSAEVEALDPIIEAVGNTHPYFKDMHYRMAEFMGSVHPEQQAQAARTLTSFYGMFELSMKFAGVRHLQKRNPFANFVRTVRYAMRGTADYGSYNALWYKYTAMINPGWSSMAGRVAKRSLRTARKERPIVPWKPGGDPKAEGRAGFGETVANTGLAVRSAMINAYQGLPRAVQEVPKVGLQSPFLLFPHTIYPEIVKSTIMHPHRAAKTLFFSSILTRLIGTAVSMGVGVGIGKDLLMESMAGAPGNMDDDEANLVMSEEAIEYFVKNYSVAPFLAMYGGNPSWSWNQEIKEEADAWTADVKKMLLGARGFSIQPVGRKGAQFAYADLSEPFRPFSWIPEAADVAQHGRKALASGLNDRNTFWDAFGGFIGLELVRFAAHGINALQGEEGKTTGQSLYAVYRDIQRNFAAGLSPATTLFSEETSDFIEATNGQSFEDWLGDRWDPAYAEQPMAQRLGMAALETALRIRYPSSKSRAVVPDNGLLSTIGKEALAITGARELRDAPPVDMSTRERRILQRHVKTQFGIIARSMYFEHAYGDAQGWGIDNAMKVGFAWNRDLRSGDISRNPTTPIGKLMQDLVSKGYNKTAVVGAVVSEAEKIRQNGQLRTLYNTGARARMHPNTFLRLWKAADRDDLGLLREAHRTLIGSKEATNLSDWFHIVEGEAPTVEPGRVELSEDLKSLASERATLYRELMQWFQGKDVSVKRSKRPYTEALKSRVFDVAPEQATKERAQRPRATRLRYFEGLK